MLRFARYRFAVLLVVGTYAVSTAQVHSFQYYTMKEGLLADGINALFQDSRGYLWIGTAEGVSVYDGHGFTSYRARNGLATNFVTCITESRRVPGTIWIGTNAGGVSMLVNGQFTTLLVDTTAKSKTISALLEDRSGTLWCATEGGVYTVRNGRTTKVTKDISGIDEMALIESPDGILWCAINQTVVLYSPAGEKERIIRPRLRPREFFTAAFIDRQRNVWLGTTEGQLLQFRDTVLVGRLQAGHRRISSIVEDRQEDIWISSELGLFTVPAESPGQSARRAVEEHGLLDNRMNCALIDRENDLWLGTVGHGLCKLSDRTLLKFPHESLPGGNFYQSRATSDCAGHYWVVEPGGVAEIWKAAQGDWKTHLHRFFRNGGVLQPTTVALDARDRMGVGFLPGDIRRYSVRRLPAKHSRLDLVTELRPGIDLPKGRWLSFLFDEDDRLWFNKLDAGILQFDLAHGVELRATYRLANGLPDPNIRAIYKDRHGNLWFGGNDGGVSVLRAPATTGGQLEKFTIRDGLPDGHVRAILEDNEGTIWVGTRDGGVAAYRNGGFHHIADKDGLISNTIWSLSEGPHGRIWLGTALGLQAIEKKSMHPEATTNESLRQTVFACGAQQEGVVWMATLEGFLIYDYARRSVDSVPPPIYITSFLVNGKSVDIGQPMEFSYDQNTCTLEFLGINLANEKATRYQYRLFDVEPNWHQPTDHHVVTFALLRPGTYRFEARAINGDGIPSAQPASVAFTIFPPVWQTWWFRLLILLTVTGVLFGLYRFRVNKLLEVERTKMLISQDLHDELSATLSSIAYFAQAIRNADGEKIAPASRKFLSLISETAEEVQDSMSDVIWSLNPENDDWSTILAKFRRYASDLFESRSIRYRIDVPDSLPLKNLDHQQRRNLWLVYKEMVTNVARHSRCSNAEVTIRMDDQRGILLMVEDNGNGFDPIHPTDRHGVKNIRARAQKLSGELQLTTAPGAGTHWELRFAV